MSKHTKILKTLTASTTVALMAATSPVTAEPYTYNIPFSTFSGTVGIITSGGLAGYFDYDADTNSTSNINLTATLNGTDTVITGSAPDLDGNYLVFTNLVEENGVTAWVMKPLPAAGESGQLTIFAGLCFVNQQNTCNSNNYGSGSLIIENQGPASAASSRSLRPAAYTTAPDLIPSNVPTCNGSKFVNGVQVLGGGEVTWYVEHSKKDECFSVSVNVLPEGVSAKDMDEVLAVLGASFDVYSMR